MIPRKVSRRQVLKTLGAGAALPLLASCAGGKVSTKNAEYAMVIAHEDTAEHYFHETFELIKELVEKNSRGRINVKIVPNALFGAADAVTTAVQLNSVQMTAPTAGVLGQFVAAQNVWDTPYLFDDSPHAYRVLDGEFGQGLLKDLAKQQMIGLGYWDNGVRHLTTRNLQVNRPTDLDRVKIRVQPNALQLVAWKATSANPTPMAFGEVYTGLQQGTIDAQENPLSLIVAQRFYEVQDRVTLTAHVSSTAPLILSKIFYDSLPVDLQQVLLAAGQESVRFNRKRAAADEAAAAQVITDAGVEIAEISRADKQAFREAMQGAALPYLRKIVGNPTVDRLENAIAKEQQ